MFAKTIIDSDAFLDMPLSTQSLYFHLSMRADDDGFINNPKKVQRMIGCSDDDLRLLVAKNFIIPFESGIVVIKHWKIHNYIRNDRYKETVYKEERAMLDVKKNGSYTVGIPNDNQVVYQMETQVRLGKDSIGKDSINIYDSVESEPVPKKPVKHKYGEYNNVLLTDEEMEKLKEEYPDVTERIERLSSYVASTGKSYKSHYATIRNWARKDAEQKVVKKNQFNSFSERPSGNINELESALLGVTK
jgi:Asp-tRNA(Asn)/Glu-tRNA(Gln) amidotransferase C subunit